MNLIYSHSYASAHAFALDHDFMPGDWQWLHGAEVIRQNAMANVFKAPDWETSPCRAQIDAALEHARQTHRIGAVIDINDSSGMFGVSGA